VVALRHHAGDRLPAVEKLHGLAPGDGGDNDYAKPAPGDGAGGSDRPRWLRG
jgi:hypothetical protein